MSLVARPLSDRSDLADCLILTLYCHACGSRGLREVAQGAGANRRTFTGRCGCGAETVMVVEQVAVHAGREWVA